MVIRVTTPSSSILWSRNATAAAFYFLFGLNALLVPVLMPITGGTIGKYDIGLFVVSERYSEQYKTKTPRAL
jgi:hypothetical protein